jgi:hypothetical protein
MCLEQRVDGMTRGTNGDGDDPGQRAPAGQA